MMVVKINGKEVPYSEPGKGKRTLDRDSCLHWQAVIETLCLRGCYKLSDWEQDLVNNLHKRKSRLQGLTQRQIAVLERLENKHLH